MSENIKIIDTNKPFLLNQKDLVFYIESGELDIFSVKLDHGNIIYSRKHIFQANQSQFIFSIGNHNNYQISLLAVPNNDTIIKTYKKSHIHKLSQNPQFSTKIYSNIENWICSLYSSIIHKTPPVTFEQLIINKQISIKKKTYIRTKDDLLWVNVVKGLSSFTGYENIIIKNGVFFPISKHEWLYCIKNSTFYSLDSNSYFSQDSLWSGLDEFHKIICKCFQKNNLEFEENERNRLLKKNEMESSDYKNTLKRLSGILSLKNKKVTVIEQEEDLLFSVCQVIGKKQGIKFEKEPASIKDYQNRLDIIARASKVRLRKIMLKHKWWNCDNGAFLGFLEDGDIPVALTPVANNRYEMYDHLTRTKKIVKAKDAEELSPFGYVFYKPLGDDEISGWELFKLGIFGCQNDMIMVLLMGICGSLLGLLVPIITGLIFDIIIPEASKSQLVQIALILITCAFVIFIFEIVKAISMLRLETKLDYSIQAAIWDRLLSLPVSFFRKYSAGDLANRSLGINVIRQIMSGATIHAFLAAIFSSFNLILIFFYDWRLALIAILIVFISVLLTIISSLIQIKYQRIINNIEGKISGLVLQFITGICKLRVTGTEDRAFSVWAKEFSMKKYLGYKSGKIENIMTSFNSAFPLLSSMAIFSWVILQSQDLTTGRFIAFSAAYGSFQNALLQMSTALTSVLNIIPLYERAKPIIKEIPEDNKTKESPGILTGDIEVRHVNFRYKKESPLVINDISMHFKPEEYIALVGSSGSGKSTIVRILLGFEEPDSGVVYYDGQNLKTLDMREVRRQIGVVLQNGKLFEGDIFTNIVGNSNLTIDDAWEAAKMAGLDEDIDEMPMGMHTIISAGGGTLSGGQRQRLLIARAIVRKPRIIFFDEATSALDNNTQAIVSQSLDNLKATRIVIAHRLSTIINAEKIYVLEKGSIVQSGTYDELIKQKGLFAELAKRQIA